MKNINILNEIIRNAKVPKKYYIALVVCVLYLAGFNVIFSYFIQLGISIAIGTFEMSNFSLFGIGFVIVCLLFSFAVYGSGVIQEKIIQIIARSLKSNLLKKIIDMPTLKIQEFESGDLLTRLTNDCDNCSRYLCHSIMPVIQLLLSIMFGLLFVCFYSFELGLIAIIAIPVVYWVNLFFSKKMEKVYGDIQESEGELRTFFTEFFNNGSIIKVFDLHKKLYEKFNRINEKKGQRVIKNGINLGAMAAITEILVLLIEFFTLLVGIYLQKRGLIGIGILIGVWNATIGSVVYPATELPEIVGNLSMQNASLNRISFMLEYESDHISGNSEALLNGMLNVKGLKFGYNEEDMILKDVSFTCGPGDIVYITGESGSGKSTLVKNLLRLCSPEEGSIYISNENSKDIEHEKYISYIPQGNSLFNMSIMENIKIANPEVNDNDIILMAKEVGVDEFVQKLPLKYDTMIGADFTLSEGQSQRIAILRALVKKSSIFVFDEPFSAQDSENRELIMNVIEKKLKNHGCIIISHLEQSLAIATKVYKLEGGYLNEKI